MSRTLPVLAALGALLLVTGAMAQSADQPLQRITFESPEPSITGLGPTAAVTYVTDPANVKEGRTALRFTYELRPGEVNALLSIVPPGMMAPIRSLRLWFKAELPSTYAVILQEEGGGRWASYFAAPRNEWLQVQADASDFVLLVGSDQPADPNGRLDMDRVSGVGIVDFVQVLLQTPNAEMMRVLGITPGRRTLFLDDVALHASSLPPAFVASGPGAVTVDTFARTQPMWVALGVSSVSVVTGAPLTARGLRVEYARTAGSIAAIMRAVPKGRLAGARELSLSLASRASTRLLVQIEEVGGGKYNAVLEVEASTELRTMRVNLTAMQPADDSRDTNNRLDLDQVHQIVIFDPTGLLGGGDQGPNTIHIGSITTRAATP